MVKPASRCVDIATSLQGTAMALSGRDCAEVAELPYKVAIDALCRLHDAGIVVRIGRKYSATWALAGTPAAQPWPCRCQR